MDEASMTSRSGGDGSLSACFTRMPLAVDPHLLVGWSFFGAFEASSVQTGQKPQHRLDSEPLVRRVGRLVW
jgi:hypothetical protein